MNFKINLKPYPGAEYFTVQEYLRAYNTSDFKKDEILMDVESKLRNLFHVPADYTFKIIPKNAVEVYSQDVQVLVKDNPDSGIDLLLLNDLKASKIKNLDLSYSFPQIPSAYDAFDSILVDPAASLGIPIHFIVLFSHNEHFNYDELPGSGEVDGLKKSMYVLNGVLENYVEKGKEVLLRESNYKAAVLYQMIESSPFLEHFSEKQSRSKTIISATCDASFLQKLVSMGYDVGHHQENDKTVIRIANYPTHSKELIEMLADRIMEL